MIKAWWRAQPLSEVEEHLLAVLFEAHEASCYRNNVSSVTISNAAQGSNDVGKAIAAAILTLGGRHAPLEQTCEFLRKEHPEKSVEPMVMLSQKIPGWGGSFQTDEPDRIWAKVNMVLHDLRPTLANKLDLVTLELARFEKHVMPNPSAYTASVAIALGMPSKLAVYLFISARLDAWAQIAIQNVE